MSHRHDPRRPSLELSSLRLGSLVVLALCVLCLGLALPLLAQQGAGEGEGEGDGPPPGAVSLTPDEDDPDAADLPPGAPSMEEPTAESAEPQPLTPKAGTPAGGTAATEAQPLFGAERSYDTGDYVSLGSCANGACHGASEAQADRPILGNEYTSRVLDPHFRAAEVLSNELSREIMSYLAPGQPAKSFDLCLACHYSPGVLTGRDLGDLSVEDGVSCQSCHGAAGGWWDRHYEDGWTHDDSVKAGLNDLRNPATRASTCMGCHLGTGKRKVDHRLIAAGHPVLTFELDNYSQARGLKHWKSDYERQRRESHGLRAWAVGQGVAFREGLELLADKAGGQGPWPEFAELACSSCHHTVGDGSWRQQEGWTYRQGFPPWSPARWAVLRHLVDEVASDERESLDQRVEELDRLVTSMGDRQRVAELASGIAKDLGPIVRELDGERWSARKARGLIEKLAGDREYVLRADEASARQVALSLQSLAGFLVGQDPKALRDRRNDALDGLFAVLDEPGWDRMAFVERLGVVGE